MSERVKLSLSKTMNIKTYLQALCFSTFMVTSAFAELPQGIMPDSMLLAEGRPWHYRTTPGDGLKISERTPTEQEKVVIEKVKVMLGSTMFKAIALVDGNNIVWSNIKSPASQDSYFWGLSMHKTVTGAAVGKAICAGKIDIDARAEKYVPELMGTHLGASTIKDLLKMSSGTWQGNSDTTNTSDYEDNQIRAGKLTLVDILSSKRVSSINSSFGSSNKPGEKFVYHSTDPMLLGVIINRTVGTSYSKWTEQQVLVPAGIESPAIIAEDRFNHAWAEGGLRMKMKDWVHFAAWYREARNSNDCFGNFLKDASTTQIKTEIARWEKKGYGYLVWTDDPQSAGAYWAVGHGGQRIAWNPKNSRIIVALSNAEETGAMSNLNSLYNEWSALP